MTNRLEIYNQSNGHLGNSQLISDPNENSPSAKSCEQHYAAARKATLRLHNWKCAGTYRAPSLSTEENLSHWNYMYDYPNDCLKIRKVSLKGHKEGLLYDTGTVNGQRVIYCNEPGVIVHYTFDQKNEAQFDPLFTDTLSIELAIRRCKATTGKTTLKDKLESERDKILTDARSADLDEEQPEDDREASWIEARN
ncbi:MAG: hypothetical protein CL561_00340 [Alphaproteobacteria bacterium]|nr:hypothetical protein [Alphaproteobacteria bacterium]|tara:strand:+ start:9792 stop:10376 length:585 start_codon:yes stop_codon:yes gene_type:complete